MLSFKKVKMAIDVVVRAGHVPNIIGLQGIGKSDLVREYAREKGYAFKEITCSLLQEGDLAMPYLSRKTDGDTEVAYSINNIITDLCKESVGKEFGILFLDEFNRASSQCQSELMNIVLQREILGFRLADNIRVILAMNPSSDMDGFADTDYSVSFSDAAMLGRVCSIVMQPNVSDWIDYGSVVSGGRSRVHSSVLGFLGTNPKFFTSKEVQGKVNASPRGWSRLSDLLYSYEDSGLSDDTILINMLKGTMDSAIVDLFFNYYKTHKSTYKNYVAIARSILNGKEINLAGYSNLELKTIFESICSACNTNSDVEVNNVAWFLENVNFEIAWSLINYLENSNPELYNKLLDIKDFSAYVMSVLSKANSAVSSVSGVRKKGA